MAKLLFRVLESFNISGRGVSVITDQTSQEPSFRNGDEVELHRPDGSSIKVPCCIEIMCRTDPSAPYYENYCFAFMGLSKTDVPPGTQAFQLIEHPPSRSSGHYEEVKKPEDRRHSA